MLGLEPNVLYLPLNLCLQRQVLQIIQAVDQRWEENALGLELPGVGGEGFLEEVQSALASS